MKKPVANQKLKDLHPTRPPRMEGKVKEAMMNPRKKRGAKKATRGRGKQQKVLSKVELKAYQLPTRGRRR